MKTFVFCFLSIIASSQAKAIECRFALSDTSRPLPSQKYLANTTIDSNMLIVVDGIPMGNVRELKSIDYLPYPTKITGVVVLNDSVALKKYGDKGKYGVIEVSYKNRQSLPATTTPKTEKPVTLFEKSELEAEYTGGGQEEFRSCLERNLNSFIPEENGAPSGKYTVLVRYMIDIDSVLRKIEALTNHGYGMEKEVIRVIAKCGTAWAPAMQNGKPVRSYRTMPVTFIVNRENEKPTKNKPARVHIKDEEPSVFQKVEMDAYPKNGEAAFLACIQNNLKTKDIVDIGAPDGTYTSKIQLLIDTSGIVIEAKPSTMHGYGMEEEAVRVIKKCSNWVPAVQNGRKVRSFKGVEVIFNINGVTTRDGFMTKDPNTVLQNAETEARFPKGEEAWLKFLQKNIKPRLPYNNGAPFGEYVVVIQFEVETTGKITGVKALTDHGYGMEKEAIRVIEKSPDWLPAMLNGRPVKVYRKQPVTFLVSNY